MLFVLCFVLINWTVFALCFIFCVGCFCAYQLDSFDKVLQRVGCLCFALAVYFVFAFCVFMLVNQTFLCFVFCVGCFCAYQLDSFDKVLQRVGCLAK